MPTFTSAQANSQLHYISQMPKAELHLHFEGAPRWATLREALYRHYGMTLPVTPTWYAPEFRFSYPEFSKAFRDYIHPWLQTTTGYAELIHDVVDSLLEQNIRYAEINFNVRLVEIMGHTLPAIWELLEAEVERAQAEGLTIKIFAGISRDKGVEQAIDWVNRILPVPIISGFDLHGLEVGWPADLFREAFAPVQAAGKKLKVHAGEMAGAESIRAAIESLNPAQIGHGISAVQDPAVIELLRSSQIIVEMCPTSNEKLNNISTYQTHPIFDLDAAGVSVTVNSDDPTFFGYTLTLELTRLVIERQATLTDLARWTSNAFKTAILDDVTRTALLLELDNWLKGSVEYSKS